MPTPKKGARLGGSPAHQKLILKNLATQLIEHRSLTTTEAKAKALRPFVEKLVTKAKRGDMHARRTVARVITDKNALYTLFDVIAPALDPERQGGYTRLTRVGNRKGDNAPMVIMELVTEPVKKKEEPKPAAKKATKKAAPKKVEAAEEAPKEEAAEAKAEEAAVEVAEKAEEAAAENAEAAEVETADAKEEEAAK